MLAAPLGWVYLGIAQMSSPSAELRSFSQHSRLALPILLQLTCNAAASFPGKTTQTKTATSLPSKTRTGGPRLLLLLYLIRRVQSCGYDALIYMLRTLGPVSLPHLSVFSTCILARSSSFVSGFVRSPRNPSSCAEANTILPYVVSMRWLSVMNIPLPLSPKISV